MAPARLGSGAKEAITGADAVFVSPISVYEVTRKARLGRWPEIVPHIGEMVAEGQTISAPLTRAVAARSGVIDWRHRDPFDCLIANGHPWPARRRRRDQALSHRCPRIARAVRIGASCLPYESPVK